MRYLAYVDTETITINIESRRIWDIGVVLYSDSGGRRELSYLVSDVDLSGATLQSLNVGRFRERHPIAGARPERGTELVTEAQLAAELFPLLYDATFAGIVEHFDALGLDQLFKRHKRFLPAHHHYLDIENRAIGALQTYAHLNPTVAETHADLLDEIARVPGRWKTDALAAAFGVPVPDDRHTGIGDARYAEQIYHAIFVDHVVPEPGARWRPPPTLLGRAS